MNTANSAGSRVKAVRVNDDEIIAYLVDGRSISVPLAWLWRLSEKRRGAHVLQTAIDQMDLMWRSAADGAPRARKPSVGWLEGLPAMKGRWFLGAMVALAFTLLSCGGSPTPPAPRGTCTGFPPWETSDYVLPFAL